MNKSKKTPVTVAQNVQLRKKIANLRKRLGIKSPAKKTELIEARHAFVCQVPRGSNAERINRKLEHLNQMETASNYGGYAITDEESLIGQKRYCSCCGSGYTEWKEQDLEGYRCQRCTISGLRREVREYQKGVELLCSVLSPENSSQLRSMPFYAQRKMVDDAHEDGILSY